MKDNFVTYEQALALKELGFDEPCFGSWEIEKTDIPTYTHFTTTSYKNSNHPIGKTSAPLKQQVFRWFREKYDLYGWVKYEFEDDRITPTYYIISPFYTDIPGGPFKTYEEAEDACIDKLIELIKK